MQTRRVARFALRAFGYCVVFFLGTSMGVIANIDLAASRRLVAQLVTRGLGSSFRGQLFIDKVGHISLIRGRISGADAHVLDAEGETILVARGVSAHISVVDLLGSLVRNGPIVIALDDVRVDMAEGALREEADGMVSFATAFLPRPTVTSSPIDASLPTSESAPGTSGPSCVSIASGSHTLGHTA